MTDHGSPDAQGVLSGEECATLLASQRVGRLGVLAEHYPLIIPVNYGLDAGVVVVRVHRGLVLAAADHANVTFEVDVIDPAHQAGWSVLVRGLAEEVTDHHRADLVERTKAHAVQPWEPGEHDHWLRIIPHEVTGRRIAGGPLTGPFELGGYL